MAVLDLSREHRMIGPADEQGQSWALQDGRIFTWSESNCQFEDAWWLDDNGLPRPELQNPVHLAILRDRPFDPAWMKEQTT